LQFTKNSAKLNQGMKKTKTSKETSKREEALEKKRDASKMDSEEANEASHVPEKRATSKRVASSRKDEEIDEDNPPYYLKKRPTPRRLANMPARKNFKAGRDKYYELKNEGKIEAKKGTWLAVDGKDGVIHEASTEKELYEWRNAQTGYFSPFIICHMKRPRPHEARAAISRLKQGSGDLNYIGGRIGNSTHANGKAVEFLFDTGSEDTWIKQVDVNQTTVSNADRDVVLADGTVTTVENYQKYVNVDNLKTRADCCVGSRTLGLDVIKRYRGTMDYVANPQAPVTLCETTYCCE